MFRRHKIKDPD